MILLGFSYLASSMPSISLAGVAIGVGLTLSMSMFPMCRNPIMSNVSISRAFIGSSLVEVPGSIGSVYSLLIPYAFYWCNSCIISINFGSSFFITLMFFCSLIF